MSTQPVTRSSNEPLGTSGDLRRRVLLHHVPLALGSAIVLALFMGLPIFNAHAYPHPDIVSGALPQKPRGDAAMGHDRIIDTESDHERDHNDLMRHGRHGARAHEAARTGPTDRRADKPDTIPEGGDHSRTPDHSRQPGASAHGSGAAGRMGDHGGNPIATQQASDVSLTRSMQQLTVATGYLGLGLLAVTLLLGPANLVLRRRNPVSTYLRRDVGIWTAIFSTVHVICAVFIHVTHGRGVLASFVHFFIADDGRLLTNSFGWGNWTGLAAIVIALVLFVTSNDATLRTIKARPWKWLQRLNYALILLVVIHAFFYGAFLRMTSPFTLLLVLSTITVVVGQAVGVWLWRRRCAAVALT